MNPNLLSIFLFCAALTSCAYHNAWHTPVHESSRSSQAAPGVFYPEAGHLTTAGIVARCSGLDEETSLKLAYFSQAPDDVLRYNAVPVAVWGKLLPPAWGYHQRIMKTLHSLHGGDNKAVENRRQRLATMIANMDKHNESEHWKIGFLIHALGDSYAHVHPVENKDVAYGPFVGHGLDNCVFPDHISEHLDIYVKYTAALSEALGGPPGGSGHVKYFNGELKKLRLIGSLEEREDIVQNFIRAFGASLVDTSGVPVWVNKEDCYKKISFSEANSFLKKVTQELK
jgi:hypothetical protein